MTDVTSSKCLSDLLLLKNLFIYPNEYYLGGADTHLCAAYPLEHFFSPNITGTSLNSLTLKKMLEDFKIKHSFLWNHSPNLWSLVNVILYAAASNWSMRIDRHVQWNIFVIPDLYGVSRCLLRSSEQYFITSLNTSSTVAHFIKMVWLYFFICSPVKHAEAWRKRT